jgi:hypothetical protein
MVERQRIETVLAAYRTSMHRPVSAADVAAADRWAIELVTLAKALTPAEKERLERRLGGWKASALIAFAKRAAATTLADRASGRLVDAVLALELAGLTHPDPIERGLTFSDLLIPFHAALTVDESFLPLWLKVRPLLDASVREEVAADLADWQDDPTVFDDLRITRADDGTYRYEWDAAI